MNSTIIIFIAFLVCLLNPHSFNTIFSESDSTELRMDVVIEQKILAWEQDSISSFQILEYRYINNKAESDSNLYYGIYADWDLDSETENKCVWDPLNQIGIVYNVLRENL